MNDWCESGYGCPVEATMSLIGGRWKSIILCKLVRKGNFRFNQLLKDIDGVSSRILSKQLKELEKDGLISRTECQGTAMRVEYSITEKGESLVPILLLMSHWGTKNLPKELIEMNNDIKTSFEEK